MFEESALAGVHCWRWLGPRLCFGGMMIAYDVNIYLSRHETLPILNLPPASIVPVPWSHPHFTLLKLTFSQAAIQESTKQSRIALNSMKSISNPAGGRAKCIKFSRVFHQIQTKAKAGIINGAAHQNENAELQL
jgi:hypothetical protein